MICSTSRVRASPLLRALSALALLGVMAGCSWFTPPMSSEEVIQRDPAFAEILKERATVSAAIHELDRALEAERHTVLQEIQQRREALRAKEQATQAKQQTLEERLAPAREILRAKLAETEERLRQADATAKSLRRARAELARLLQSSGAASTENGRQWRAQLAVLDRQAPPLEAQIVALRQQRQLYQAELRLLSR